MSDHAKLLSHCKPPTVQRHFSVPVYPIPLNASSSETHPCVSIDLFKLVSFASTLFGRNCSYNPILPLPPLSATQLLVHWYPSRFDFSPGKIGQSGYLKAIMIKIYRSKALPENVHSGTEHSKMNIASPTSGSGF